MSSLLRQLALTAEQVRALPDDLRTRVVDFLLRWEAYSEAQQCLGEDGSSAALELRARAARGLGHLPAAIALYKQRIQRSAPAPLLVALAQTTSKPATSPPQRPWSLRCKTTAPPRR